MKKLCGAFLAALFIFSFSSWSEANMMGMGTKPVISFGGGSAQHFSAPIFFGSKSLEGSKPVLLMLGETPRTTLTTQHLRREPWKYERNSFEGTKPVIRMLSR